MKVALIGLEPQSNRWSDPALVTDVYRITTKEFDETAGHNLFVLKYNSFNDLILLEKINRKV